VKEYLVRKREIYREYAKTYDEDRHLMVGEEALSGRIGWALSSLQIGYRLLDLGCGTGDLLLRASTMLGKDSITYGLDLPSDMLAIAAEKLKGCRVGLVQANVIGALPFANSFLDLITSLNLLQELSPSFFLNVLREAYRVLKPEGWFQRSYTLYYGYQCGR
jgi:ubiquinone/menaquinone biosynthesis C-methylase UbiE